MSEPGWTLSKPISGERARAVILGARPDLERVRHVLAADDDAHVLQILEGALGAAGCRVDTFLDASELLSAARRESPDVLVIDLLSRGADGVQVLAQVRADRRLRRVPVVALLAPELTLADLDCLDRVARALVNGRRWRAAPSSELVRALLVEAGHRPQPTH